MEAPIVNTDEIRFVGDLQRLEVRPGDRFVLMTDQSLSIDLAKRLQESLVSALGAPVIVLSDGLQLGVIGTASE